MKQKVDKGFCFSYWGLSYRRNLIRTLWSIPFIFVFFLFPKEVEFVYLPRNIFIVLLFLLCIAQALYNWIQWNRRERHRHES